MPAEGSSIIREDHPPRQGCWAECPRRRYTLNVRRYWTAALVAAIASVSLAQEAKIKPFDTLTLITAAQPQYSGDFVVASDGVVSVPVVGRVAVGGKTVAEAERELRTRVRKYVRNAEVSLTLKLQAPQFVYLASERVTDGAVPWMPGMTVRQLIAKHPNLQSLDSYTAKLYRQHKETISLDLDQILKSGSTADIALEAGDVLALLPAADMPVWILGLVMSPGQIRIEPTDGLVQAIALAGGQRPSEFSNSEIVVNFRRGADQWRKSLSEVVSGPKIDLQAGDTVVLEPPRTVSATVGGFVLRSGDVKIREGAGLIAAIQAAGGPKPDGTLARIVVFRKGDAMVYDGRAIAQGGQDAGPQLQDGDFVYVPENLREYHVLGFVNKPGARLIPDSKDVHLADALSSAEGLRQNGTYRHAVVMRPGENGHYQATRYDLDKYIKDGDINNNPKIESGDIVFFDQTSGTLLNDILRIVPSLILLDRFF